MKTPQNVIILRHLEDVADWQPGYNLEKINSFFGWISHSGMRTCRTLAETNLLDSDYRNCYVYYRINDKGREYLDKIDSPAMRELRKEKFERKRKPELVNNLF